MSGSESFSSHSRGRSSASAHSYRKARNGSESCSFPSQTRPTGTETYASGRYLDLRPTATGLYTIDFNYAYNPYCAYNKTYECPFPPRSNRLKVPIRAGEKVPAT